MHAFCHLTRVHDSFACAVNFPRQRFRFGEVIARRFDDLPDDFLERVHFVVVQNDLRWLLYKLIDVVLVFDFGRKYLTHANKFITINEIVPKKRDFCKRFSFLNLNAFVSILTSSIHRIGTQIFLTTEDYHGQTYRSLSQTFRRRNIR